MPQPGHQEGNERVLWWKVAMHLDEAQLSLTNAIAHSVDDPTAALAVQECLRTAQAILLDVFSAKGLLPAATNGVAAAVSPVPPPSAPSPPMPQPSSTATHVPEADGSAAAAPQVIQGEDAAPAAQPVAIEVTSVEPAALTESTDHAEADTDVPAAVKAEAYEAATADAEAVR